MARPGSPLGSVDERPHKSGRGRPIQVLVTAVLLIAAGGIGLLAVSAVDHAGTDTQPGLTAMAQTDEAVNQSNATIEDTSYAGLAVVRYADNTTYLFATEPHHLTVNYSVGTQVDRIQVCFEAAPLEREQAGIEDPDADIVPVAECNPPVRTDNATQGTERFEFTEWPEEWIGEANVTVELVVEPDDDEPAVDQLTFSAVILDPEDDFSGGGLSNAEELEYGTDFARTDTDHDGLSDREEIFTYGTDPLARDTAGNGVPDGVEILLGTDPTNPYTPHVFVVAFAILISVGFGGAALYITSGVPPAQEVAPSNGGAINGNTDQNRSTSESTPVLTDQDRVIRLLEEHDGQIKQQEIVERTDWSKSKVSRLLSRMEEQDTISRVRIGRENVITRNIPEDVEAAGEHNR